MRESNNQRLTKFAAKAFREFRFEGFPFERDVKRQRIAVFVIE